MNELSRGDKRPLHWAAQRGQAECAERLLSLGAEKDCVASDGLTPLLTAAAHGRSKVVALLLEAGSTERFGFLCLFSLILFAGANIEAVTPEGLSVLHLSAREGDAASMGLLISKQPKLLNALSNNKVFVFKK